MDSCWPAGNLGCHSSCPSRRNSTSDPASSVFHHSPQVSLGGALRTGLLVSPGASGLSKPATDGPKGAPWRAHPAPFLANPWGALMRTQSLPLGGRKQLVDLGERRKLTCPTEGVPCLRNAGGRFEFCEVILANGFFTTVPLQGDYVDSAFTRVPQVPG